MGPPDDVYQFGPFRLEIPEKLLSREGVAVPLEPTQFQVLSVLVRAAGHLVTRDELTHAVWHDTYVDEGSLTVTISHLRRKLGDTAAHPTYIETVRKSGYRFVAPVRRADDAAIRHGRMGGRLGYASMAAILALAGWYWSPSSNVNRDPAVAAVALYPFGGVQDEPSFSPDGSQVAFAWRPPHSDNHDIYLLKIGELNATRLTTDPAWDKSPAWSPDGRQIAFVRRNGSTGEIVVMSPAGGPEHTVARTQGTTVGWSPDSRSLVFVDRWAPEDAHSIFLMSAAGGAKRQLTFTAAEKTYGDASPAISPDGRTLAFVRHVTYDVADLYVQPVEGGNPRRLTFANRQIRGLAWMPRSDELIFSSNRNGRHELWRVRTDGTQPASVVEGTSEARFPAVSMTRSPVGVRLLYQAHHEDYNSRTLERSVDGTWRASASSTFAASTRDEQNPRLSPDGRHLAFVSDRSRWFELWICAYPQASNCRQLTSFSQGYVGSPMWSPDSQRIAFDARADGNADVYVVRADGGQPVRLTHETSVESRPTWSGDGRWIYFRSDRTGSHQIWKMPAAGGAARQVTTGGGFEALESPDGTSLYYVRGRYLHGLSIVPVDGGVEGAARGFGSVRASTWTITDNGILWIDLSGSNPPAAIRFKDFATNQVSTLTEVPGYVIPSATGLSASRDGRILMWSQLDRSAHDLMLVERFR